MPLGQGCCQTLHGGGETVGALAVLSLTQPSGQRPSIPAMMITVLAALLVAARRPLLITLLAGLTGYLATAALIT